jgi:predicted dehydrogenase
MTAASSHERVTSHSAIGDDLSVAVLGVGNVGSVHLQSAVAIDGVSVTAAADAVTANRARANELGAGDTYDDFERLLDAESVDVAVVALPPSLHQDAAIAAMEAGCDVFVEKPLGRTTAEAEAIRARAAETDATLGVDHTLRYQDEIQHVKDVYEAGRLGHVPLATIRRINHGPFSSPPDEQPIARWQLDPAVTGGGALLDLGVHLFDVLEWVFGECEVVDATLDQTMELPYEDTACVRLCATETGTMATLQCGFFQWEQPPAVNTSFRLDGVADSIDSADHVPDFHRHALTSAARNVARSAVGRDPNCFAPTYYYRAHYRALEAFLAAVGDGRPAPVDGETGRRAVELVERAYAIAADTPEEQPDCSVTEP